MAASEPELWIAWQRCIGDRALFDTVISHYREPHRWYHGLDHLVWTIRHLDDLVRQESVEDLGALLAAAFFHDVVHDPVRRAHHDTSDEQLSADYARRGLMDLGWSGSRAARVAAMIEATEGHRLGDDLDPGQRQDTAILLDADLAILGSNPEPYRSYVTQIRAEYAHLDDPVWRTGRAAVIREFLSRDRLYVTDTAFGSWEARARANLTSELSALRVRAPG